MNKTIGICRKCNVDVANEVKKCPICKSDANLFHYVPIAYIESHKEKMQQTLEIKKTLFGHLDYYHIDEQVKRRIWGCVSGTLQGYC